MRKRRKSRVLALWMLYSMELGRDTGLGEARNVFSMCAHRCDPAAEQFALELVRGVMEHRDELDRIIRRHARNWALDRMALVDRQIMRIALYELLYQPRTPPAVCINEAIDIAKMFSTAESGHFINGVLDAARRARAAQAKPAKPSTA